MKNVNRFTFFNLNDMKPKFYVTFYIIDCVFTRLYSKSQIEFDYNTADNYQKIKSKLNGFMLLTKSLQFFNSIFRYYRYIVEYHEPFPSPLNTQHMQPQTFWIPFTEETVLCPRFVLTSLVLQQYICALSFCVQILTLTTNIYFAAICCSFA